MKPDLSQSDFDGLVQRSNQLTAHTRARLGMEDESLPTSTPFDRMVNFLVKAAEVFGAAVLVVILVALACGGGTRP
jgi:hypothetical protein